MSFSPWIGRLNIDNMAMLPNRVRRFNVTPMVIPMKFFCISEKASPQIHRGLQRTTNKTCNRRTKRRDSSWFLKHHRPTVIKTMWSWHNHTDIYTNWVDIYTMYRHIHQSNRAENLDINPYIYGQLIFDKDSKAIHWGKEQIFQQIVLGQMDMYVKRLELDAYLTPYTNINSKLIDDLKIKSCSYKTLRRKHRGESLWFWIC